MHHSDDHTIPHHQQTGNQSDLSFSETQPVCVVVVATAPLTATNASLRQLRLPAQEGDVVQFGRRGAGVRLGLQPLQAPGDTACARAHRRKGTSAQRRDAEPRSGESGQHQLVPTHSRLFPGWGPGTLAWITCLLMHAVYSG